MSLSASSLRKYQRRKLDLAKVDAATPRRGKSRLAGDEPSLDPNSSPLFSEDDYSVANGTVITNHSIDPLTQSTEWKIKRAAEFMRGFGLDETEEEMLRALEAIDVDSDDESQWSSPVRTTFQDPFVSDDSESEDDEVSEDMVSEPMDPFAPDEWTDTGTLIAAFERHNDL